MVMFLLLFGVFFMSMIISIMNRALVHIANDGDIRKIETQDLNDWELVLMRNAPMNSFSQMHDLMKNCKKYIYNTWNQDMLRLLRYKDYIHQLDQRNVSVLASEHTANFCALFPSIFNELSNDEDQQFLGAMKCRTYTSLTKLHEEGAHCTLRRGVQRDVLHRQGKGRVVLQ
jgi:hypothetical protein